MTNSSAITTTQSPTPLAFLHNGQALEHLYRVAKVFSMSGMVPQHFQGKPEACLVALMYAEQLGEHPMVMFQEVAIIKGKPSTSAKFSISRANKSGLLSGPITWETTGSGESLVVTAKATMKETGERIDVSVSLAEAKADGWTSNSKYRTMPEQMLRWRSATRLINLFMPEVLLGLGVKEEMETIKPARVQVEDAPVTNVVAELNEQITAQQMPVVVQDAEPSPAPAADIADPF
jgi:hypothetical protein